jgi:hypothetical protein
MLERLSNAAEDDNEHERLFAHVVHLDPRDWNDYGLLDRWAEAYEGSSADCSCGCRFYRILHGSLGFDWGVCTNPASHRNGLLTFEHQGCPQFEDGEPSPAGP